jgi:hypothetical protein
MSYQAGDTYPAKVEVRNPEGALVDPITLQLKVRDYTGALTTFEYPDDAIIVNDSTGIYHADVPLTGPGMWVIAWQTTDEEQIEGVRVWVSGDPSESVWFCSPADIAQRKGRELTTAEQAQVAFLCEAATDVIATALDKPSTWVDALTQVPRIVHVLAVELVARNLPATADVAGVQSVTETLGQYSYTTRYGEGASASASIGLGGLVLTPAEERMVRRAVYGTNSASTMPRSVVNQLEELRWDGEIASGVTE